MIFCKQFVTAKHNVKVTLHVPGTELMQESSLKFALYVHNSEITRRIHCSSYISVYSYAPIMRVATHNSASQLAQRTLSTKL